MQYIVRLTQTVSIIIWLSLPRATNIKMAHGTLVEYQASLKAGVTNRISVASTPLFRFGRVRMPRITIRIHARIFSILWSRKMKLSVITNYTYIARLEITLEKEKYFRVQHNNKFLSLILSKHIILFFTFLSFLTMSTYFFHFKYSYRE